MTDAQILKKAIEQAIADGADAELFDGLDYDRWVTNNTLHTNLAYGIIFSHLFAKAFWGEDKVDFYGDGYINPDSDGLREWQYHLSNMVLESDPIKYLERFLKE